MNRELCMQTVTRFIAADAALISIPPVAVRLSYHPVRTEFTELLFQSALDIDSLLLS